MGKRRGRDGKEGELANFPEEGPIHLTNPRYLAIAASLILVFSVFASLLVQEDITGQATSPTLDRWRSEGWTNNWQQSDSNVDTNLRDHLGRKIVPETYTCPKRAISPPAKFVTTSNSKGCYNRDEIANKIIVMCTYEQEVNGNLVKKQTQCVLS